MKIYYRVTLEDVAAQGTHHIRQMFGRRWDKALGCLGLAVACFFLAIGGISYFAIDEEFYVTSLLMYLTLAGMNLFASIMTFTYPRWASRITVRELARMNKAGKISGLIGPQELELTEQGLVFRSRLVESCLKYEAVRLIESELGYTFISTTLSAAFVIPHAAVTEGDPVAFADVLRAKLPDGSAATG
jgi:hypothetical protein